MPLALADVGRDQHPHQLGSGGAIGIGQGHQLPFLLDGELHRHVIEELVGHAHDTRKRPAIAGQFPEMGVGAPTPPTGEEERPGTGETGRPGREALAGEEKSPARRPGEAVDCPRQGGKAAFPAR